MASTRRRAPGPNDRARYVFLEGAQAREKASRILGSVIPSDNETEPYDHFRPNWRDPDLSPEVDGKPNDQYLALEKVMGEIWTDANPPVELLDVLAKRKLATSDATNLKFTSLVNGRLTDDLGEEVQIEAGVVTFYTFDNPGANLHDRLLMCEPWKRQVEKLINSGGASKGLYIVTGVAVVKDVEVSWAEDQNQSRGVKAEVPGEVWNAATQGFPVVNGKFARALDFGGDWQKTKQRGSQAFAKCSQEIIIAVKYNELNYEMESEPAPTPAASPKKSGLSLRGMLSFRAKKPTNSSAEANGTGTHTNTGAASTNGHSASKPPAPSSPDRPRSAPKAATPRIEIAHLGRPIRGFGLSGALGAGGSDSEEDDHSEENAPLDEEDVFYVKQGPFMSQGTPVYPNGGDASVA